MAYVQTCSISGFNPELPLWLKVKYTPMIFEHMAPSWRCYVRRCRCFQIWSLGGESVWLGHAFSALTPALHFLRNFGIMKLHHKLPPSWAKLVQAFLPPPPWWTLPSQTLCQNKSFLSQIASLRYLTTAVNKYTSWATICIWTGFASPGESQTLWSLKKHTSTFFKGNCDSCDSGSHVLRRHGILRFRSSSSASVHWEFNPSLWTQPSDWLLLLQKPSLIFPYPMCRILSFTARSLSAAWCITLLKLFTDFPCVTKYIL